MAVPDALWRQYRKKPDNATRELLFLEYAPLVRHVASKMAALLPKHVDREELISYGILGLLEAIGRYDPDREVKFETYATARIRGAILQELRRLDWVPRSTRHKAHQLEDAVTRLENKLGRPATDEELAEAMGLSLERFHQLVDEVKGTTLLSLDSIIEDTDGAAWSMIPPNAPGRGDQDPSAHIEHDEMREILARAIDRLPDQERLVIALYYYEDMTLREIAEVLGVSESRVSQIHTKAAARLRGRVRRAEAGLTS